MPNNNHKTKNSYKKIVIGLVLGLSLFGILFGIGFLVVKPLFFDRKTDIQSDLQKNIPIHNPSEPEPYKYINISSPPNSLGFTNGTIRIVNESFFWSFFENHSNWKLEYTSKLDNPSWVDVTQEALVFETIRMGDYEKQNVNFTAPYTGYYRLNYTINATINDYSFNGTHHEYSLNVSIPNTDGEFYWVYYNWSDIIKSEWNPYIIYNHGITQDNHFFLQVDITSKISKNSFLSLDPNFGNEASPSDYVDIRDVIRGTSFTTTSPGNVTSITAYISTGSGWSGSYKHGIYRSSDKALIGYTEVGTDNADTWQTLNIVGGGCTVNGSEDYYLVSWASTSSKTCSLGYSATSGTCAYDDETFDGFPDPWAQDNDVNNYLYCIYATYVNVTPNATSFVPVDEATQQSLSIFGFVRSANFMKR